MARGLDGPLGGLNEGHHVVILQLIGEPGYHQRGRRVPSVSVMSRAPVRVSRDDELVQGRVGQAQRRVYVRQRVRIFILVGVPPARVRVTRRGSRGHRRFVLVAARPGIWRPRPRGPPREPRGEVVHHRTAATIEAAAHGGHTHGPAQVDVVVRKQTAPAAAPARGYESGKPIPVTTRPRRGRRRV